MKDTFLNDRLMRGILAGTLAYIPTWIFNHFALYFKITKINFADFASFVIFGAPDKTNFETWFARFGTMFFLGLCGALFVLLVPHISSRYFYFKAWFYAAGLWFLIFAITKLFKIDGFTKVDASSALSNLIGASIWGLATAFVLKYLNRKHHKTLSE